MLFQVTAFLFACVTCWKTNAAPSPTTLPISAIFYSSPTDASITVVQYGEVVAHVPLAHLFRLAKFGRRHLPPELRNPMFAAHVFGLAWKRLENNFASAQVTLPVPEQLYLTQPTLAPLLSGSLARARHFGWPRDRQRLLAAHAFLDSPFNSALVVVLGSGSAAEIGLFVGRKPCEIKRLDIPPEPYYWDEAFLALLDALQHAGIQLGNSTMATADFTAHSHPPVLKRGPKFYSQEIQRQGAGGVAAAVQNSMERSLLYQMHKLEPLIREHAAICIAGNSALNNLLISVIHEAFAVKVHVPPCPCGDGEALGLAQLLACGAPAVNRNVLVGLPLFGGPPPKLLALRRPLRAALVADILSHGGFVAVVRGRNGIGPFTTATRSIFASLASAAAFRARFGYPQFRPLPIVTTVGRTKQWTAWPVVSPYGTHAPLSRKEIARAHAEIIDGRRRLRIQTINRNDNPWLYDLLEEIGNRTGHYALLQLPFIAAYAPLPPPGIPPPTAVPAAAVAAAPEQSLPPFAGDEALARAQQLRIHLVLNDALFTPAPQLL
eukprot:TRINITY_DN10057_c0_g1_i1.p1 TRINITY_DN10057_c0_g1~~TRINITY_DN10057_c0_g1_i1.p1  ORF type:complete len:549 (-),score=57.64 TRINITY_DN10057_c0_g1_i1:30-1676(-)